MNVRPVRASCESCYGYACHRQGLGRFIFRIKRNGIGFCLCLALDENLVQSASNTLDDKITFQQVNYLKHKAKYTLELYTKMTLNVPEWPCFT
jgi:hypothetical protein